MRTIIYKELEKNEISVELFLCFNRYQEVNKCWRKERGEWVLKQIAFNEQWGTDEYKYLVKCLQNTLKTGGIVIGAFNDDALVGFASIESQFFGKEKEYLQLSSIHISYESRGMGIGKKYFFLCVKKQRKKELKRYIYICTFI